MNHAPTKLNVELKLFCPRRGCPCYQSLDNNITKDGVYTTKNDGVVRQMFNCGKGKHRFSETGYCDLFGKHGSFKEYEPVGQQHRHEWARGLKRHAFQACLSDRANFGTLQSVCRMAR